MRRRVLVLAGGPNGAAGVDVDRNALVRLHFAGPGGGAVERYSVIEAEELADDTLAFATDSVVVGPPVVVGSMGGRRTAKLLSSLTHPPSEHLLGFAAASAPYWSMGPSLALIEPAEEGPVVERDWALRLRCKFAWRRAPHDLPLHDAFVAARLTHPTCDRLGGKVLARALGWRPQWLLVALTPPHEGRCHKVVAALLPSP